MEHLRSDATTGRVQAAGRAARSGRVLGWALALLLLSLPAPSSSSAADPSTGGAATGGAAANESAQNESVPSGAAPSGGAPTDSRSTFAYDLATELMSPFCPGRTVASCPSPQAAELIQWIATQEAAGASRDEVVAMLIERYGEEILGAPPARGITLWAYVFPVMGFVAFGAIAVVVLRRIVAPKAAVAATSTSPSHPVASPSVARATASASGTASATSASTDPAADELARIVDAELAERA